MRLKGLYLSLQPASLAVCRTRNDSKTTVAKPRRLAAGNAEYTHSIRVGDNRLDLIAICAVAFLMESHQKVLR
jgi:hypothetical protein